MAVGLPNSKQLLLLLKSEILIMLLLLLNWTRNMAFYAGLACIVLQAHTKPWVLTRMGRSGSVLDILIMSRRLIKPFGLCMKYQRERNKTMHKYSVILVKSTNQAMKVEHILHMAGILNKLIPVPRYLSSNCGNCVQILSIDKEKAVKVVEANHLEAEGVFDLE